MKNPKISIVSLGCPKNLADMESVLARINNADLVNEKDAEFVFLNTCGFLKAARDEVFENIEKLRNKKIIVLGCLAGQFQDSDFKKYPQIYGIVTSSNYKNIQKIFNRILKGEKVLAVSKEPIRFETFAGKSLLTPRSYAYVKIAEGCDNRCSYCYIPYLKGKYRSRKMQEILNEIKGLLDIGVKEIILVAQDCGCYGKDLYGENSLYLLLKKIAAIKGNFWIRVLYIYPERIDEKLLNVIASSEKICKYLDIPLQHGDKEILRRMARPNDPEKILKKIELIRKKIPNITLRTSMIVGFPGETEAAFKNLLKFIKEIKFDNLGVFEYSREPHTPAYLFPNQILEKIKRSRREKAMLLQQKISFEKNKSFIGKTIKVLVGKQDPHAGLYVGRSERYAPDIDGEVILKSNKSVKLNNFYDVEIVSAKEYDLIGK